MHLFEMINKVNAANKGFVVPIAEMPGGQEFLDAYGEIPLANRELINGKVFDQTQKGRPTIFRLGELITGWNTALREMPAGSRWEIVIPYHLGYGTRQAGVIKPYSTLIFDITLLDVR